MLQNMHVNYKVDSNNYSNYLNNKWTELRKIIT